MSNPGRSRFTSLDLSVKNRRLESFDIAEPQQCQAYIDEILKENEADMAYGGYLEVRDLYKGSPNFDSDSPDPRNIHLGLDIWAPAGTRVLAPIDGKVHSFADNKGLGNYGPTVILEHNHANYRFYTLYGHLSRSSLSQWSHKRSFDSGEILAELGAPDENGYYAPHLHFQVIWDLESNQGDYPGVCSPSLLEFMKENCPNPNLLLKIGG